jgi:hypothetical protein
MRWSESQFSDREAATAKRHFSGRKEEPKSLQMRREESTQRIQRWKDSRLTAKEFAAE